MKDVYVETAPAWCARDDPGGGRTVRGRDGANVFRAAAARVRPCRRDHLGRVVRVRADGSGRASPTSSV